MSTAERPFRHLCPEADMRDAMLDDEFWAHVFHQVGPDGMEDYEPGYDEPSPYNPTLTPCDVCGELGACGYDAEGRVLIHWQPKDEAAS